MKYLRFYTEQELAEYLEGIVEGYSRYAPALWASRVTTTFELAFGSIRALQEAGITNRIHAETIKADATERNALATSAPQQQAAAPAPAPAPTLGAAAQLDTAAGRTTPEAPYSSSNVWRRLGNVLDTAMKGASGPGSSEERQLLLAHGTYKHHVE